MEQIRKVDMTQARQEQSIYANQGDINTKHGANTQSRHDANTQRTKPKCKGEKKHGANTQSM